MVRIGNGCKMVAASIAVMAALACSAASECGRVSACGCEARWSDGELKVSNADFSRTYVVSGGVLRTVSFRGPDGAEWQRGEIGRAGREALKATAEAARWSPVGAEGLRVRVETANGASEIFLFPGVPGVIARHPAGESVRRVHDLERDFTTLKADDKYLKAEAKKTDSIRFAPMHVKATILTCVDQTDIRDRLLVADERQLMSYVWASTVAASALDCRDVISGRGLAFVRLAPMPASRPGKVDDFILSGENRMVAMLANGYPLAELAYCGGEVGRQRALIAFQRAIRPYRPGRDGMLVSNTWGGGNRDSRINQEFLLKEIEAGSRMGVDVIQIDDGWQRGRTANSMKQALAGKQKVWSGYWSVDPDFWKEDLERFPDGLAFLVGKARERGMRFGLWFGPDSSDDAANWERDAECLLDYHRRLGVDYFKMDSMKLHTTLALQRNRKMFDKMLSGSNGDMVFDLDCTAEVRPGFLGLMDVGPLFLENRYTRMPVYWPHHTLKNLWDLSHVIDPVRLRIEFNNPDTNHGVYGGDALAHSAYRPDALFAIAMTASPLAWMELSDVSEKSMAAIAPLVSRWKLERPRWHGGVIHPVGKRPDGVEWTGFVSEQRGMKGGYALLFRELNAESSHSLDLRPYLDFGTRSSVEVIGGRGTAELRGGVLEVNVPEKLDFIWVKINADFNIADYGARQGGEKATKAINRAIGECAKSGGGRVVVPRGKWFSGAIRLKSNVELHLEDGSEILFSQDPNDYLPAVHTSWEGMECWNYCPLVFAYCCTNVAITGTGTLKAYEGEWKDTAWYPWVPQDNGIRAARRQLYDWGAQNFPVKDRQIWKKENAHTRPHFVQFNRCRNVRWENFKVRNSPFWTLHLYLCDGATVRGLDVYAHGNNNDGIDIEMTRNVLVEDCVFDQGDDGVVIKSGRNQDAWRIGVPTENVLVRNCHIKEAHTVLGIGSEISGGVRNVRMENCRAETPYRVFYLKTNRRRGGFLKDIVCENVTCREAKMSVFEIATDILYEWAKFPDYETRITEISDITARNITVGTTKDMVRLCGDARLPPQRIRYENIDAGKVTGERCRIENVK